MMTSTSVLFMSSRLTLGQRQVPRIVLRMWNEYYELGGAAGAYVINVSEAFAAWRQLLLLVCQDFLTYWHHQPEFMV